MTDFGLETLPYCSFVLPGESQRRVGVGVGADVVDLTELGDRVIPAHAWLFTDGTLNGLLGAGPRAWQEVRTALQTWVGRDMPGRGEHVHLIDRVRLALPFTVADYVDFYASEHHATNVGRIFRPDGDALTPNWKHLPIGYHGRAGTVVGSGTPIRRPSGQRRPPGGEITFGPSVKLDFEAEVGFVVGAPSRLGAPVPVDDFESHVFGICLVNDWSARDIQAWEYVPLGPFLGKSFATSISPWIVPLAALESARVEPPVQDPAPLDYLRGTSPWGLDLELVVTLNGTEISRPPFATMYWTGAQMMAHMTVNGASLRTGDLYASGTVSGPDRTQRGSMLELSWNGTEPITLADGTSRTFLEDGDIVTISATARPPGGRALELGQVTGTIVAAR